jgi:hypothetical protein
MSVKILLGVVASVAGQPAYFPMPPPTFGNSGPCDLLYGFGFNPSSDRGQCCLPVPIGSQQQACSRPRGAPIHPMLPTPVGFWGGRGPSRNFLEAVCCKSGQECCPEDNFNTNTPTFKCCDSESQYCAVNTTTSKGECTDYVDGENADYLSNSMPLDPAGRCPDGGSPAMVNPHQVMLCSLNTLIPSAVQSPLA